MTVHENKALVRRVFEEIWNEGKLAVVDELYAPGFRGHDPFLPKALQGIEGFKHYVTMFRTAFPDLRFTIEALIGEDDHVVARWIARGTFTAPLLGYKPTGKEGLVTGVTIFRLAGDKVVTIWIHKDDLRLLQDMGVVPELGVALV